MKQLFVSAAGLLVFSMVTLASTTATAQTSSPGPYYVPPAWDQTLPASTRFIVLSNFNNEAVLDRETGLVWQRSPLNELYIFSHAHGWCITQPIGGRKGWRLPTIQELESLIDVTRTSPALPQNHPFLNVRGAYWSATRHHNEDGSVAIGAWVLGFNSGDEFLGNTVNQPAGYVWCVRGGQGTLVQ